MALRSEGTSPLDMRALDATFPEAYKALVNEGPVTCVKTGKTLPSIPAPDAAVLDVSSTVIRGSRWDVDDE